MPLLDLTWHIELDITMAEAALGWIGNGQQQRQAGAKQVIQVSM